MTTATSPYLNRPLRSLREIFEDANACLSLRVKAWTELLKVRRAAN